MPTIPTQRTLLQYLTLFSPLHLKILVIFGFSTFPASLNCGRLATNLQSLLPHPPSDLFFNITQIPALAQIDDDV